MEASIRSRLRSLAAGVVTPDEVSAWALHTMEGDSPQLRDARIWTALDRLSGADLLEDPGQYLHGKEDVDAWLEEFEGDGAVRSWPHP
ncbi:DNA-binding protein [Streptomyces kanamyceticus]|uniref:DNA-binding protein n=1 Tax=Streptomyces kanamyceticus TaxID=1967 RepID=A0A5J6GW14_STRKN|nr:DNA-binding protein [Streptomyces kanamyceticus]